MTMYSVLVNKISVSLSLSLKKKVYCSTYGQQLSVCNQERKYDEKYKRLPSDEILNFCVFFLGSLPEHNFYFLVKLSPALEMTYR